VRETHPIIIHNNDYHGDMNELQQLIAPVGYRFFLKDAQANAHVNAGGNLEVSMRWQNLGTSPIYLKMGQDPRLYFYLVDQANKKSVLSAPVDVDFSTWLPADPFSSSNFPVYQVDASIPIPASMPVGSYTLLAGIVDNATGSPIQLAVDGVNANGQIVLFDIKVQ
jgi:hypothetical protein